MQAGKIKLIVITLIVAGLLLVAGAVRKAYEGSPPQEAPQAATSTPSTFTLGQGDSTRDVPGWNGRPYDLHIPKTYNPSRPAALILAIHGGGVNSGVQKKLMCPEGNFNDPKCFNALSDREGFVVAYPNGTSNPTFKNVRTWNAGGGKKGFSCVSGVACEDNIDDISYFKALLDDLYKVVNVDRARIYATGISNGAAMSHRLACELSNRIAAVAPIAGGNQFSTTAICAPSRRVPVLEIHGTADSSWLYLGGEGKKSIRNDIEVTPGIIISIPQTVSDWASRNGCASKPRKEGLLDQVDDGTTVTKESYSGCRDGTEVVFYTIQDGGHTWPQGWQYFPVASVGKTTQDINANEVMWEFFKKHPMK